MAHGNVEMLIARDADISGERYGSIVVLRPCGWANTDAGRVPTWVVKCDCGAFTVTVAKLLTSGDLKCDNCESQ